MPSLVFVPTGAKPLSVSMAPNTRSILSDLVRQSGWSSSQIIRIALENLAYRQQSGQPLIDPNLIKPPAT